LYNLPPEEMGVMLLDLMTNIHEKKKELEEKSKEEMALETEILNKIK